MVVGQNVSPLEGADAVLVRGLPEHEPLSFKLSFKRYKSKENLKEKAF